MASKQSRAVTNQRTSPVASLDYFPTPLWGTRALFAYGFPGMILADWKGVTIAEPACGQGHMADVLLEMQARVTASDVYPYGYGEVRDFLGGGAGQLFGEPPVEADWYITNPPFVYSLEFFLRAWATARRGVALLLRTNWLEGVERYERMFAEQCLSRVYTFSERLPMNAGRVDTKSDMPMCMSWFVFDKEDAPNGFYKGGWIPPCRAALERPGDYRDRGFVEHAPARETPGLLTACT